MGPEQDGRQGSTAHATIVVWDATDDLGRVLAAFGEGAPAFYAEIERIADARRKSRVEHEGRAAEASS